MVRAGSCWVVVKIFLSLLLLIMPAFIAAQEDEFDDSGFGFGEPDTSLFSGGAGGKKFSVNIGGKASAELKVFYDDFTSAGKFGDMRLGDIFSGSLNFEAASSAAQAVINLELAPVFDGSSPVKIDEAFLRVFFGPVTVEGGFRKLVWGKADSFGPLDVINPIDYTDLSAMSDPKSIKIGRPMLRTAWAMGAFSKLEAVFVPWFHGHKFAASGRWTPNQINDLKAELNSVMYKAIQNFSAIPNVLLPVIFMEIQDRVDESIDGGDMYPQIYTLNYAQAAVRFTTSIGSSDLGFQYYFGRFHRPAIYNYHPEDFLTSLNSASTIADLRYDLLIPDINYNYYHQIAADFARVVAGFNIRAEAGINLTKDLNGTDGAVENPAIVWSLGFDRDLVWGINLNLQGNGKVRLFHHKLGSSLRTDCEAGTDMSSTRITGILSKKLLRDELELKVTGLWGIEDRDFLIMPAVSWERNELRAELSTGVFGGDKKGELGQYNNNSFLKLVLSYRF